MWRNSNVPAFQAGVAGAAPAIRSTSMTTEYQDHYRKNAEFYKERQRKRRDRNAAFLTNLKESTPCADCGMRYPFYVMQFDHLGEKRFTISERKTISLETLKKEIEKCEIVCANCHAVRTYIRSKAEGLDD